METPIIGFKYPSTESKDPFCTTNGVIATVKDVKNGYVLYEVSKPDGKPYTKLKMDSSYSIEDFWILYKNTPI